MQTEALGRRVVRTPWREGWPIDAAAIEQALRDDRAHEIQAVLAVHTDTASGVTSDLAAMRRAIDAARHPALLVADVVASLAAAPFAMDALGIDVAVGASQKGLMCPPGVGFIAVNAKAMAAAAALPGAALLLGLGAPQGRAVVPQVLRHAAAEPAVRPRGGAGADVRRRAWPRCGRGTRRLAGAVQAAVAGWRGGGALEFFAQEPASRSVSVTTIAVRPEVVDVDALRTVARERFQVAIAGGLGPLGGRAFRIGHLGDCNPAVILGAIAGVEAALLSLGVAVGEGGVQRAVQFLAAD